MSNHFNAKALESIDTLTSALLAAHEELPPSIVQCGHVIHRAVDDFAEACYLYRHGGIELAEDEFRRCKRSLKTALELLMAASVTDEGTAPDIDAWCEDDDDSIDLPRPRLQHYND